MGDSIEVTIPIDKRSNRILYAIDRCIEWMVGLFIKAVNTLFPFVVNRFGSLEKHKRTLVNVVGLTGLQAIGGLLLMFTQVKLANILGASLFGVYSNDVGTDTCHKYSKLWQGNIQ